MSHSKAASHASLQAVQSLRDKNGPSLRLDRELRRLAQHEAILALSVLRFHLSLLLIWHLLRRIFTLHSIR